MVKIVLGIDGGGTRTRAVLISEKGEILGAGEAGPGNPCAVGHEEARGAVSRAVTWAWKDAGQPQRPVDAAFLGLAGAGSPETAEAVQQWAAELNLAPQNAIHVDTDLRIALAGDLGNAPGLVLVAGTGSACYGRLADGRSWQAGGWGWKFDDPGSAYWFGIQALGAAALLSDPQQAPLAGELEYFHRYGILMAHPGGTVEIQKLRMFRGMATSRPAG